MGKKTKDAGGAAAPKAEKEVTTMYYGMPSKVPPSDSYDKQAEMDCNLQCANIGPEEISRRWSMSLGAGAASGLLVALLHWMRFSFGWYALTLLPNLIFIAMLNSARNKI
jgi:hypothetical protein